MSHYNYKVFRGTKLVYDSMEPPLSTPFKPGDYCRQTPKKGRTNWYSHGGRNDEKTRFQWNHIPYSELPKELKLIEMLVS